jgi:hypothetical protein
LFLGGCETASETLALCGPAAKAPQPPADLAIRAWLRGSGWSDNGCESDGDSLVSEAEDRFMCSQLSQLLFSAVGGCAFGSRVRTGALVCDSPLAELELCNSVSWPEAGRRAVPRPPCLLLGSLSPWHGPCRLAWHDQDLRDSSSDPLAFMWVRACSLKALSVLWRLGQCVPNAQHESKVRRSPSQSRPASAWMKGLCHQGFTPQRLHCRAED